MLAQNFQRADADPERSKLSGSNNRSNRIRQTFLIRQVVKNAVRLFVLWLMLVPISCGSTSIDLRSVIPADALVYLETGDLGAALDAITINPRFQQLARSKPDTSFLKGTRLSIAVTGFQVSEEPTSDEGAILNFKPQFVAIVETNAWNYQARSFTENKLGEFVNDVYGGEVELVTSNKHGGTYFTWTAKDGRRAFALVRGSLIMFGNNETAIDNCVNVLSGGAASIAKNAKVSAFAPDAIASGYVSKDGVAQIANIAAVSLASGAGEEGEVKNFISRFVPEIVRNSVTDISWAAKRIAQGRIEDSYVLSIESDAAKVLSETVVAEADGDPDMGRFIPKEFVSTTRYDFKDAQIAWRSVLMTARTKTDQITGTLLPTFSSSLFEPYAIDDAERFLSSVDGVIETVRFDGDGEEVAVTARIKDLNTLKASLSKELELSKPPEKFENADIWRTANGELAAAIVESRIIAGEAKSVERCLIARNSGTSLATVSANDRLVNSSAPIVTFGTETDNESSLIAVLSDRKDEHQPMVQNYTVESRVNHNGIERRTISDFGLIGMIVGRLNPNE